MNVVTNNVDILHQYLRKEIERVIRKIKIIQTMPQDKHEIHITFKIEENDND